MKSFIAPTPLVYIKFSTSETAYVYGCATWFPTCTKQRLTVYEDGLLKIPRTVHGTKPHKVLETTAQCTAT